MLKELVRMIFYAGILTSLFVIDYILGNGFVDMMQKLMCKIACFVRKTIREEAELSKGEDNIQIPFNFSTLFIELLVLLITSAVLQRYKHSKGKDRFDELLHESKEALRLTDEFLEKWRMRRMPSPSYLDEEPQEIKPLILEVPILHMAIVDTRGSTRSQPERGDADSINYSDSAILSVVSLVEDNGGPKFNEMAEEPILDEYKNHFEVQNRYLWDVEEEDPNVEY